MFTFFYVFLQFFKFAFNELRQLINKNCDSKFQVFDMTGPIVAWFVRGYNR